MDNDMNEVTAEEIKEEVKEEKTDDVKKDESNEFSDLEGSMTESVTADHSDHLPIYGVGPKWSIPCAIVTLAAVVAGHISPISNGIPKNFLRYMYIGFGVIIIIASVKIWVDAIVNSQIDAHIMSNKLCTTGIYKYTRNPIYAALLGIYTGVLFISGNAYMYVLPIFFWIALTIMLKKTEEVWLLEKFGDEYSDYYTHTNRILPGPRKK